MEINIENSEEAFATLRALDTALGRRIKVTTSRIQLCRNDQRTTKFDDIEGITDEETLHILEESVSDIISSHDHAYTTSTSSSSSQGHPSASHESAAILNDLSIGPSVTSAKTKDSFYSIPSCGTSVDGIPAGLVYLRSLSAKIGRQICVWCSDNDCRNVARIQTGKTVYRGNQKPGPEESESHWTLPDNLESRNVAGELNDCLFNVVAAQTGNIVPELRARTVERIKKNVKSLANRIDAIARLEKCDRISLVVDAAQTENLAPEFRERTIKRMQKNVKSPANRIDAIVRQEKDDGNPIIPNAAYHGQTIGDAKKIIENSQQGICYRREISGHPRGHAPHPGATGATECAENYSKNDKKSAFLSREDQDAFGHLVLQTPEAKDAMEKLNRGKSNIPLKVPLSALKLKALPKGVEFLDGTRTGKPRPIREFVIVLSHYQGEQNNPEADVFVHTFYPVLELEGKYELHGEDCSRQATKRTTTAGVGRLGKKSTSSNNSLQAV